MTNIHIFIEGKDIIYVQHHEYSQALLQQIRLGPAMYVRYNRYLRLQRGFIH